MGTVKITTTVNITESPRVGSASRHPSGDLVYVTSGDFEVNGRISNFWYWNKINDDGTLCDVECNGYGW